MAGDRYGFPRKHRDVRIEAQKKREREREREKIDGKATGTSTGDSTKPRSVYYKRAKIYGGRFEINIPGEVSPAANFTPLSRDKPRICARFNLTPFPSHSPLPPLKRRWRETIEGRGKKRKDRKREKIEEEGVRDIIAD